MKDEYQDLFKTRKWKLALSFLPLDTPTTIRVKKVGDLMTLRVRASEFSKESEDRKVSVNVDYESKSATITVTRKS